MAKPQRPARKPIDQSQKSRLQKAKEVIYRAKREPRKRKLNSQDTLRVLERIYQESGVGSVEGGRSVISLADQKTLRDAYTRIAEDQWTNADHANVVKIFKKIFPRGI